jgi:hypothetical protein
LDVIVQIGAKADVERERKMGKKCGRRRIVPLQLIFLPLEFLGYDVFEGGEPPPLLSDDNESILIGQYPRC